MSDQTPTYEGCCPVCRIVTSATGDDLLWALTPPATVTPYVVCPSTHARKYLVPMAPAEARP